MSIIIVFSIGFTSFSQPLLYSNFSTFSQGNLSGQNGWTNNSSNVGGLGSCTGPICTNNAIVNNPISYPSFDNATKCLSLISDQDGVGTGFTSTKGGSVYLFLLCQFSNIPGTSTDLVRIMGGSNYSTSCRIYLKNAGGGFYAGVGKGAVSGVYNGSGPTLLGISTPHLLVLKYTFNYVTTSDDVVTLYIDPDMSLPEPTTHEIQTSGGTDAVTVDRLCFPYNATNKATGLIGAVKVTTTWSDGFSVVGKCITPNGTSIKDATISATGATAAVNTDTTGTFTYKLQTGNYTLKATREHDINKTNGVTSLDLALIQSHILGKATLNSPYKVIAADVNGDGKVTALDIVYMKRLILGLDTTFNNPSTNQKRLWVFIDSSSNVTSLPSPFVIKDSINITNLNANKTNQTFYGIKLGDVNWDWSPLLPKQTPSLKQGKKEEGSRL